MATISRRQALTGAATVGWGLPLLAACGDDGTDPTASDATAATAGTTTDRGTTSSAPGGDGIPTSDVPVGGGVVLTDPRVVITQPTEGEFHAFTAICTHAQCPVARVTDEIECDCHGSRFSIEDGSVVGGPAPAPLAAVDFTVARGQVVLG